METLSAIASFFVLLGLMEYRIKRITKEYLVELKPNHGSSVKDKIDKLENRIDDIYKHLLDK